MYLRTLEGFRLGDLSSVGQPAAAPKDELVGTCQAWVVNVQFKKDYKEFRAEALKGIGRHLDGQAKKTQLETLARGVDIEDQLVAFHTSLLKQTDTLNWHKNNIPMKVMLHFSTKGALTRLELALLGGYWVTQ